RNFSGPGPEEFRPPPPDSFRRRGDWGARRGPPDREPPPPDRGPGSGAQARERAARSREGQARERAAGSDDRPGPGPGPGGPIDGAVIIELDREVILKELIPALAARHFASHDEPAYRIAILAGGDKPRVLYSSAGAWSAEDIANPDRQVNLFGPP